MDKTTHRKVGKSELTVSPLGFGSAPIGSPLVSNQDSLETVAAAWNSGVRFFDTAPWYGVGRSERRLGLALAEAGAREEFRINTKVGRTLEPEPERIEANKTHSPGGEVRTPRDSASGHRVHFDYSSVAVETQLRDSLERLGTGYVDSLTLHDIDYGYHSESEVDAALTQLDRHRGGGAEALEEMRASGTIKAIGCGCNREMRNVESWRGGRHEDLVDRIADTIDLDFLVIAGPYTLLVTRAMDRILPLCRERGIGVIIGSPYAGGLLAAPDEASTFMYGEIPEKIAAKCRRMQAICVEHDVPLAAAALQFPLAHPAVAAAIPGAKTAEEATGNRRYLEAEIPAELWTRFKTEGLLHEDAPTPD